ncbi:hypothetical protein ACN28S_02015 [Cystobacter fuscus]
MVGIRLLPYTAEDSSTSSQSLSGRTGRTDSMFCASSSSSRVISGER